MTRIPANGLDEAEGRINVAGYSNRTCFSADVSSESDMNQLFSTLGEKFGGLNVLVNNAGIDSFCDLEKFLCLKLIVSWM